jgi:CIC family chloride channel protein
MNLINSNQQKYVHPFCMVALAILLGILGGLGTILFRGLVALIHNIAFFGKFNFVYNENLHTSVSIWGIGFATIQDCLNNQIFTK